MEPLTSIQVFSRVAETGSFSKAAASLDIGQPAVTKHVAKIEQRFGLQLLNRNTRGVSLTESGTRFYERCRRIIAELEDIEAFTAQEKSRTQGVLRIRAPLSFGHKVISPLLIDFMEANPDIRIDLTCSNSQPDLVAQGLDVTIRMGPLPDSSLARRVVGVSPWVMIASPDYVRLKGEPERIDELVTFDGLVYSNSSSNIYWRYGQNGGTRPIAICERIRSNDLMTIMDATAAGLGVSIVPLYLAAPALRRGSVVQLLKDQPLHQQDINAVFLSPKHMPPKIREFLSFAHERFRGEWWERLMLRA